MTIRHHGMHKQWQRIEKRKAALFSILKSLPAEIYYQNPSKGKWSVAQIANHLYLSEKLSLAYLRKKMSYPDTIPAYNFWSWKGYYLAQLALNTPYKVKAPPSIDMDRQSEVLDVEMLEQKWSALREEFAEYIDTHYAAFGDKLVYNHPFAGRFTFRQMVMFFAQHIDHHIRQIKSSLKQLA